MAQAKLYDLASMSTSTTGTGTITLGAATAGFLTFAGAGVQDGQTVSYAIFDNAGASEVGRGVYTASGTTLTRGPLISTNSNAAINLSGSATVRISAIAEDFTERDATQELLNAELALQIADNTNVALFLGASGNRLADSFDALTYVNTGGATNLDTSAAGLLKPTVTSTTQQIIGPTGTSSFGPGFTLFDLNTALTAGDVITKIGLYSTIATSTPFVKIGKRNSAGNFDIVVSQSINHPGGGWVDFTLATPYTVPGTGTYYVGGYLTDANNDTTANISRCFYNGNIGVSTGNAGGTENTNLGYPLRVVKNPTTQNLTVTSTALTAASAPTQAKLVARVKEVDTITLNTDLIFSVSRDGGTTYTAFTMTDKFTSASPTASIHVLESDLLNIAAQPSGTSMLWKAVTANNKMVEIHDVYLYWS